MYLKTRSLFSLSIIFPHKCTQTTTRAHPHLHTSTWSVKCRGNFVTSHPTHHLRIYYAQIRLFAGYPATPANPSQFKTHAHAHKRTFSPSLSLCMICHFHPIMVNTRVEVLTPFLDLLGYPIKVSFYLQPLCLTTALWCLS